MFDAKSLLEQLVNPPRQAAQAPGAGSGLEDLLGSILGGGKSGGGAGSGGAGGLDDLLRNMLPGGQGGQSGGQGGGGLGDLLREMMSGGQRGAQGSGQGGGGGLGDILGKLNPQGGGGQGGGGGLGDILGKLNPQGGGSQGGGSITDILGDLLGQATSGAREGAERIGQSTGAREAIEKMSGGKSVEDMLGQLKDLVAKNQLGAGAALGGLGALILGTETGRQVAAKAAKLGALALIGGLAYRAYRNYSEGRPATADRSFVPEAAPSGSGFEPQAISNESAALYIRAMIAAAAADGRIDGAEQQKILGSLKQAGIDAAAEEFLASELNNPATVDDLVGAVGSPAEAVQVYTAARIAIEPDTRGEAQFLGQLAQRLGIDQSLAQHIEATARSASA
jgi:uncharacterized membrane protein YebE (DUF533 family)